MEPAVRALTGGIPRALRSHRSAEGDAYGRYCRAKVERLGSLPADARPWLRAAGLLVLDLDRLSGEAEAARAVLSNGAGRRARERARVQIRQLERRAARCRASLEAAERRIEELAGKNGKPVTSGADLLPFRERRG
jgi:hypothetical protein